MHNLYARLAPALIAIIEFILIVAAGVLIIWSQRRGASRESASGLKSLEHAFTRVANRKKLAAFSVGAGVVVLRVALIPVLGVPQPRWNDEFSYLLAADTFAHGRLTNPTHPMWIHFESFHIIEQPTYMSMYPPAQGLVLALGERVGHAWIGQLLITALMFSAMCWMLQAWMPPRWAFFGAVLAALRLGILSYWMNTYWCASVAALGGILVLGAWPRLKTHASAWMAVVLAIGLIILANSRPYEGLVFSLPVAIAMLIWLTGKAGPAPKRSAGVPVLPILLSLLAGALATGYYYWRVTGSPFVMTYEVNRSQYATAPYFIWQYPRPEPVYHNAVMRDYYRWELKEFERNRTFRGYLERGAEKLEGWWQFYLGPLLTIPLFAFPWAVRDARLRLPLAICAAMIAGFAVQTWTLPHYFSPATGALYILLVYGLRHLRLWKRRTGDVGRAVVRTVPMLACAMIALRVSAVATHTHIEPDWPRGNLVRARILHELDEFPGNQLVFVRYGDHHNADSEWVWNQASIDQAKVVWARDMGGIENRELLQYFPSRRVWEIDADAPQPKLEAYRSDTSHNSAR